MATRTLKLYGNGYAESGTVSIVVNFNGAEVFNGDVSTTAGEAPTKPTVFNEICSWTEDTSLSGDIALSIAVTGGAFVFQDILGNYSGYELQSPLTIVDGAYVVVTEPDAYYGELNINTTESDGKTEIVWTNVTDGYENQVRSLDDASEAGDWAYIIPADGTFSCLFNIDASLTVTSVPTPPA